jgi:hypothetical protein
VIITSLVFIAGAVVLLVLGLWQGSSAVLSGSIAASLLAATVLVVNARRVTASRARPGHRAGAVRSVAGRARPPAGAAGIPGQGAPADTGDDDVDPPDEPVRQQVSAADAARVGRMLTEVLVVDGRPRYHLPGCVHLLGRDSEPLPVSEAVELGFSPCSLCEPDSALLAGARRA